MMCTDISHKVLRSETVLDFMVTLRQQCSSQHFPEICTKELVGLIVLTKQVVSLSGTETVCGVCGFDVEIPTRVSVSGPNV